MQELIDKQSALSACKEYCWLDDEAFVEGYNAAIKDIREAIKELPTIEPEVRHGRWIEDNTDLICSVCKWKYSDELPFMSNNGLDSMTEAFAHCTHCGAKMYADGGTISKEQFAEIMRGDNNG